MLNRDDIADRVREHRPDTAASRDYAIVFWITPSTTRSTSSSTIRRPSYCYPPPGLTTRQLPLLRGNIVISEKDGHGNQHRSPPIR